MIRETIGLPPDDTLSFFRAKGYLPADYREDWDAIWQEEHARWFTVTKVFNNQALEDIRRSLDENFAKGGSYADWKRQLLDKLKGQDGVDPRLLTSAARLRIVYDTNLRVSRAAGQWKRIQASTTSPFLMYSAVNDGNTRPLHRIWGGLDTGKPVILHKDHPWWNTHFPPCGWNCRCGVVQLSEREMKRRGLDLYEPPEEAPSRYVRSTGEVVSVPAGIDPGFAYNPGKFHLQALTPPPSPPAGELDVPRLIPKGSDDLPPLPPAREVPPERLLPADAPASEVQRRFLAAFGLPPDGEKVMIDVLGEPVAIGPRMMVGVEGWSKSHKQGRGMYPDLAALVLQDPDEIWFGWKMDDPALATDQSPHFKARVRRRYLGRFLANGRDIVVTVMVDIDRDGWEGRTWFQRKVGTGVGVDNALRHGVLAYQRKKRGDAE